MIAEIASDFELLDVWELPVTGEADEFTTFLEGMLSFDPTAVESTPARALFWVRLRVGELLGWDDAKKRPIPGCSETTLHDRLPDHLRHSADALAVGEELKRAAGGFAPLYRTDREWAGEISNQTVHGVLHFGWVDQGAGRYRAHLAIYVKPRGTLGALYMKLIEPFRHFVVYPALMRQIGRAWETRPREVTGQRG
jgi:hypothetical protein